MNTGAQDEASEPTRKYTIPGQKCPSCSLLSLFCTPPISLDFSPGKFSPAATSAARWLRRSWSWGRVPEWSGPWWMDEQSASEKGMNCDGRNLTLSGLLKRGRKSTNNRESSMKIRYVSDNCSLVIIILWVRKDQEDYYCLWVGSFSLKKKENCFEIHTYNTQNGNSSQPIVKSHLFTTNTVWNITIRLAGLKSMNLL